MAFLKGFFSSIRKIFKAKKTHPKKKTLKKSSPKKKSPSTKNPKIKKVSGHSAVLAKNKGPKLKKKLVLPKPAVKEPSEVLVGVITHFFSRISVCVVRIDKASICQGDTLKIEGRKTGFIQKVKSLQIESRDVKMASQGQLAGLKVDKEAHVGDKVYKLKK